MNKTLRLGLHAELNQKQQYQAAAIYADERNWGLIVQTDFHAQGYYPSSPDEITTILVKDALMRDHLFPEGQLVLLAKEEEWKVIGSIHTLLSNERIVKQTFSLPDTWNVFTEYRNPSSTKYDPQGDRWVCYAIQTDQSLDKSKWNIKPADIIIKGVKIVALNKEADYVSLTTAIELSSELEKVRGKYSTITHINPLTRMSGFAKAKYKYSDTKAVDYAHAVEKIVADDFSSQTPFEQDLREITKVCSLRYHLSRGARLEQVVERFRIHDRASLGYGASVLYTHSS